MGPGLCDLLHKNGFLTRRLTSMHTRNLTSTKPKNRFILVK